MYIHLLVILKIWLSIEAADLALCSQTNTASPTHKYESSFPLILIFAPISLALP